jgi:hypothetical protein
MIGLALLASIWLAGCTTQLSDVSGGASVGNPGTGTQADVGAPAQPAPPVAGQPSNGTNNENIRPTAAVQPHATEVNCSPCVITSFRPKVVELYYSESGHEAQRIPKSALSVPMAARASRAGADRLEVMTLDGKKWVSVRDVQIAAKP